jgi:hypothetical protein
MSVKTDLDQAVEDVFTELASLVRTVTLSKQNASGYNFGTGAATKTSASSAAVEGLLIDETKAADDGNRALYTLIIRSSDLPDVDTYDTMTIRGNEYHLHEYVDNGFVIEATVSGKTGGVDYV